MSSSVPAVKTALVQLLGGALPSDVPVFYGWHPDVTGECVFLGRAIVEASDREQVRIGFEYPTEELNRPVFETYDLPITLWSFRPDLTSSELAEADERAFGFLDTISTVLEDVDLGVAHVRNRVREILYEVARYERGYAVTYVIEVGVTATIT